MIIQDKFWKNHWILRPFNMYLATYACHPELSRGRVYLEEASDLRNDFQRDRDRILHSTSFRRLQYKTQVFVNHEGDMYRSRLTHSLEVAQISRGIARFLNTNEDLVEAISLSHDLGHTPFGHVGQDALNDCMKEFGGFEHNLQSLRVIDLLEKKYINFNGLNLTFETREGVLKHCSKKNATKLGDIGNRFINKTNPSIEAQVVNYADEIAYIHHDLDDGIRSKILNFDDLRDIEFFKKFDDEVLNKNKKLYEEQRLNEVLRRMMSNIIKDLSINSKKNIDRYNPQNVDDVRKLPLLINFSHEADGAFKSLKLFSRKMIYAHPHVLEVAQKSKEIICYLFTFFRNNFESVPKNFYKDSYEEKERIVADYIAGMTDRFAIKTYEDLMGDT
jgi:dGTPase